MNDKMKIVVIGGTGLIGTKLVNNLRQRGHEVVAASPSSGVNTFTGEGLAEALTGAQVVVDVANAPSWEDKAVMEFFETAGRNLACRGSGRRRRPSRSVIGCRHRPPSCEWLFAREGGPGKPDQGLQDSIYNCPLDAVLRVRGGHRPIGHRRANGSVVTWPSCSPSRRMTSPPP